MESVLTSFSVPTLANNIAPGRFGGTVAGGNAAVTIDDSTITANSGGGLAGGSSVSVNNTIIASNEGQDLSIPTGQTASYDLIGDGSGGLSDSHSFFGSVTSPINPYLGDLQDNGGLTDTMAPLINSQLLEAGEAITGLTTDQRGQPRPATGVDIGAYQTQPLVITISPEVLTSESDPNIYVGQPTNFLIQASETAAAAVTGFTVHFGDGDSQTISTPPTVADGGYYQWSVQHIYQSTPSTGSSFTVTATPIGTPKTSTVPSTSVWVAATNDSGLAISGITVESSTQVYLTWSVDGVGPFDSYEVAAANAAAVSPVYTVVAAASQAYGGGVLISGLTPDTTYNFFIYGVYGYGEESAGSVCSENSMSATTCPAPLIVPLYTSTGSHTVYGYYMDDSLPDISYQWEDDDFSSLGTSPSITTGSIEYNAFTCVATLDGAQPGAFDSITYYNIVPTIVVTGTGGNDTFNVGLNSDGTYSVTGSVTTIPRFYAPNGIDLEIEGRGGSDTLTIGTGTNVTLVTDPSLLAITNNGTYTNGYSSPTTATNTAPTGLPAPATLPSYSISSPPSGTDAFTLSTSSTASTAGLITQATATAAPGDVIALTAEDVSTSTTFYVYGQTTSGNGDWEAATIVSEASAGTDANGLASEAVSIQLPSTLPPNSIYYIYELNGSTYSAPYQINQPQIWWTDQNNAYVGGKVSLFGTNLSYGVDQTPYEGHTWVYLFPQGISGETSPILLPVWAVAPAADGSGAMDVNPYKVDVNLPSSLAAGTYEVEVYNGHGGVNALSAPALINVAVQPALYDPPAITLGAAVFYWDNDPERTVNPVYLPDGSINPAAVNDAISFANYLATTNHDVYFGIDLPPGLIDITTQDITLDSYVHLIGAGDTGNPATGTVIVGAATGLQDLIELNHYAGATSFNAGLSDMTLESKGDVTGAAVYDNAAVVGFTVERVTIDATSDIPAMPDAVGDVGFSTLCSNLQFFDSTFIGQGVGIDATAVTMDNCDFIGCGTAGSQIGTEPPDDGSVSEPSDFSLTRCSDRSFVNNITSPGGNVEYDAASRLFADYEARTNIYVGDNTASDMYPVPELASMLNGGEIVSVEPDVSFGSSQNIAVYKNTLAGDGAESYLGNSCGVSVQGIGTVVNDNNISGVEFGIQFYDPSGPIDTGAFALVTCNSIYKVHTGIELTLFDASVSPQMYCCSFSDNLINGINYGANLPANPAAAAIAISSFLSTTFDPPQYLMNIFSANIITGAYAGFAIYNQNTIQFGETVIYGDFFSSDGSAGSYVFTTPDGTSLSPITGSYSEQGYWWP